MKDKAAAVGSFAVHTGTLEDLAGVATDCQSRRAGRRGQRGRARSHEVKLAVFFAQHTLDKNGYPVRDQASPSTSRSGMLRPLGPAATTAIAVDHLITRSTAFIAHCRSPARAPP
jgi:hypothetical protein